VSDRDAADKVATMRDAVAELVHDGDTLAIEGFITSKALPPRQRFGVRVPGRWR
jgi:hypothetical protein